MQLFDIPRGNSKRPVEIQAAVDAMSRTEAAERGAVYTRASVVGMILDLVGYTADRDLRAQRILEPSAGAGDFLLPIIERLIGSFLDHGGRVSEARTALADCIVSVEVHRETAVQTRKAVTQLLERLGLAPIDAYALAQRWLVVDDFLIAEVDGPFDAVVGNPPYVRQERIPEPLLAEYRKRYKTIYDRADLYVPFFERGLDLLTRTGRLGFICANRWVKNKYGGPLRKKVAEGFHLLHYIDMEGTAAFTSEVMTYPSITVFTRRSTDSGILATRLARRPETSETSLRRLTDSLLDPTSAAPAETVTNVAQADDPWLLDSAAQLRLVRRLESQFSVVEAAGCRIGIGVATGCDRVYIGDYEALPVEDTRKLKLAMARDLVDGRVEWGGRGIVNPWNADGSLIPFEDAPRMGAYLDAHRDVLAARHTAKSAPAKWYKTIDRIYPALATTPKLLIPDIKGDSTVAFDPGIYYPHHNLYHVTSETWDLRALQAVLRSSIALLFIGAYSVRMGGGFLRFQAQYLRRIRVPEWSSLPTSARARLVQNADSTNIDALDEAVFAAYGLSSSDSQLTREFAAAARVRGSQDAGERTS